MTLDSVAGNKAKAAAILKISRHTLYDKLKNTAFFRTLVSVQ